VFHVYLLIVLALTGQAKFIVRSEEGFASRAACEIVLPQQVRAFDSAARAQSGVALKVGAAKCWTDAEAKEKLGDAITLPGETPKPRQVPI
jgi:hypothetical protein